MSNQGVGPRRQSFGSALAHVPEVLYPPEGYRVVEPGLYRATSNLTASNFPFIMRLELRTVINVSSTPLDRAVADVLGGLGIRILNACGDDAYEGCMVGQSHDIGEEVVKEALQTILDADNNPAMVVCPGVDYESARVIGCMRRLQHWSMTAIIDEYRTSTNSHNTYDINERFIERFEAEVVTLPEAAPDWLRTHLDMLQEEMGAEADAEGDAAAAAAASKAAAAAAATAEAAAAAAVEVEGEAVIPRVAAVAPYRLNCTATCGLLVSAGAVFNEKLWLLEEEDD